MVTRSRYGFDPVHNVGESIFVIYHPKTKEIVRLNGGGNVAYASKRAAKCMLTQARNSAKESVREANAMRMSSLNIKRMEALENNLKLVNNCCVLEIKEEELWGGH